MSNAFNNYLSGTGYKSGYPSLRDYQHASRLYVDRNYAYSPKVGFLYYVVFNINPKAIIDEQWAGPEHLDVGLLVKRIDLPKFSVATETLNQYNRKTVVQTKLTYSPVSVEFHDDNADIINKLWINYYKHYYADSNYGSGGSVPEGFRDTKYSETDYQYGIYDNKVKEPFLTSIEIYTLHQQKFTQVTLVNPKITEWAHDSLNQAEGNKVMQNKMQLAYENVFYNYGQIVPESNPVGFSAIYYDKTPSPLNIAGNPLNNSSYVKQQTGFDKPGSQRVFGRVGGNYKSPNPILDIATSLAKNYVNENGIVRTKAGTYNIASGALGAVAKTAPGKYYEPPSAEYQPGIFNLPGGAGINIFKAFNTSVDGKIRANPAAIIFPPRG
jgi:hypothetical protein